MSAFNDLMTWYRAQCDGDWEHQFGVRIATMDNPDWVVRVDLRNTLLESVTFDAFEEDAGEEGKSWITCRVEKKQFVGMGDPTRLEEIVKRFVAWAKSQPDWLAVPEESVLSARDDWEFWQSLGPEVQGEACRRERCGRPRITQSVLCRRHQYEAMRGRPCPY
jgi:hypothetical protein